MSVINQMLRDLDARGEGGRRRDVALAAAGQGTAAKAPARSVWLGALAFVLVVLVVAAMRPASDAPAAPMLEPAPVVEAEPMPPEGPLVAAKPTPQATLMPEASPTVDRPPSPAAADRAASPVMPSAPNAPFTAEPPPPTPRVQIERVDAAPPLDPVAPAREALAAGDADRALVALAASGVVSAEAEALRATALQQLGRHDEAVSAYRRALRVEPDIGAWWVGLGISLEATGAPLEARDAYREAQRRGPLAPALTDYLGERLAALSPAEPSR